VVHAATMNRESSTGRVPPNSLDAERAVLGLGEVVLYSVGELGVLVGLVDKGC
jgi:hypothetical protein